MQTRARLVEKRVPTLCENPDAFDKFILCVEDAHAHACECGVCPSVLYSFKKYCPLINLLEIYQNIFAPKTISGLDKRSIHPCMDNTSWIARPSRPTCLLLGRFL